jgi:hypothetical protein
MWYIHPMGYHLAIKKKNKMLIHATAWMSLSDRSDTKDLILHNVINMKCPDCAIYRDCATKLLSDCGRLGGLRG